MTFDEAREVVAQAIDECIFRDSIVYLEHTDEMYDELLFRCDDRTINYGFLEFWGNHEGNPWRIHVEFPDDDDDEEYLL